MGGRKKKIYVDGKKKGKMMCIKDFISKCEMDRKKFYTRHVDKKKQEAIRIVWSESDGGRRGEVSKKLRV